MSEKMNLSAWISHDVVPFEWASVRQAHTRAFLEQGLPTKKDERWKYANISFLADKQFVMPEREERNEYLSTIKSYRLQHAESILLVFINGYFMQAFSDMAKLPTGVIASPLHEAFLHHPELVKQYWTTDIDTKLYPFASLNLAAFKEGLFLYLPDHYQLDKPIQLLSLTTEANECMMHLHHLMVLGDNSKLTLLEEHHASVPQPYFTNHFTSFHVGREASLTYYKLQHEGKRALHIAQTFVDAKCESKSSFTYFSLGAQFARDELVVKLQGEGAECKTGGLYYTQGDQQFIDHHIDMQHLAPRSTSEMLYKGILDNKSQAVFNGRVYVAPAAQKIMAHQENHHLLLSKQAEAYSKPELEIYADDVKCKHGATTGQLDQEALFYLRARGISLADATTILLQGFAEDVIRRITHAGIQQHIHAKVAS